MSSYHWSYKSLEHLANLHNLRWLWKPSKHISQTRKVVNSKNDNHDSRVTYLIVRKEDKVVPYFFVDRFHLIRFGCIYNEIYLPKLMCSRILWKAISLWVMAPQTYIHKWLFCYETYIFYNYISRFLLMWLNRLNQHFYCDVLYYGNLCLHWRAALFILTES